MKSIKDYINLLPQEEKKPFSLETWGIILSLVFIVVWLGLFGRQVWQYRLLQNRITTLNAQKQTLQVQADALRKELTIASPSGMTRDKAALIQDILQERVLWSEVFKQLSRIVPSGLWFDYLEGISDGKVEIKIKGGAFSYISIADFMASMEKSGYFEHPQLSYAQKAVVQGQDMVGFEIICGMKKSQGAQ
ncbi:MAG: PilN domain-containing protein [Nitrospirae bacterium]|nr:PilN domain-containing protein [Nitrospirota bacterium]